MAPAAEYTAGRDKLIADRIIKVHECGSMFVWKSEAPDAELPGTKLS